MAVSAQRFTATIVRSGSKAYIEIPFDPGEAWGEKARHYVQGTVGGYRIRGVLSSAGTPTLSLGPAWRRDRPLPDDGPVEVVLMPDGPQAEEIADDITAALDASPAARTFFQSVAPFYRKNFLRWIEEAKRPETRTARINEMVRLLEAGQMSR